MMNRRKGGMMGGFGGFGMAFGFIFMLLFAGMMSGFGGFDMPFNFSFIFIPLIFVGIFILVSRMVRRSAPGGTSALPSTSDALEILKGRFAKGEISKEEFAEMKKELLK